MHARCQRGRQLGLLKAGGAVLPLVGTCAVVLGEAFLNVSRRHVSCRARSLGSKHACVGAVEERAAAHRVQIEAVEVAVRIECDDGKGQQQRGLHLPKLEGKYLRE